MSNPIAVTVADKLVTTDTSASSLVVGGASPTATTGTGGVNAGTVTGNTSIADGVGTMATIRAGGIGIASQAARSLILGSSATQFTVLNGGTSLQAPRINAAANAWEFYSPLMTLIKEGSGTANEVGATNVDTFALNSTLTIKDTLIVVVRQRNTGSAANINGRLYNSTDSVDVSLVSQANNNYYTDVVFINAQSTTRVGSTWLNFGTGAVVALRSTFTTSYAGAWTIALRHAGITAPDTWEWEWAIYKLPGQ